MKKTRYYAGFTAETEPFHNGYMVLYAETLNQARHMMKKILNGYKKLPKLKTSAEVKAKGIEAICSEPYTYRGEYYIYKEKDQMIWCNVRLNVVFHEEDDIFTSSRVMAGEGEES